MLVNCQAIARHARLDSLSPNEVADAVDGMKDNLEAIKISAERPFDLADAVLIERLAIESLALYDKALKGVK